MRQIISVRMRYHPAEHSQTTHINPHWSATAPLGPISYYGEGSTRSDALLNIESALRTDGISEYLLEITG